MAFKEFRGLCDKAQIWILGIINTSSKQFRLEGCLSRNNDTLKKFIIKFVKSGNSVISEHWIDYNFLIKWIQAFSHIKFYHGICQFGFSLTSTWYIEAILYY